MAQHPHPRQQPDPRPAPPSEPSWDIAFTRLSQTLWPLVDGYVRDLAQQLLASGLCTDAQVRQTPRGLSTFLAVTGPRGLLCIVEVTLIDGMAVRQGPRAALDIRLLDACGDVAVARLGRHLPVGSRPGLATETLDDWGLELAYTTALAAGLARVATVTYLLILAHFDHQQPAAPSH